MNIEGQITEDRNPILEITIDDIPVISFSVQSVDVKSRGWLLDVLKGQVKRAYERGYNDYRNEIVAAQRILDRLTKVG